MYQHFLFANSLALKVILKIFMDKANLYIFFQCACGQRLAGTVTIIYVAYDCMCRVNKNFHNYLIVTLRLFVCYYIYLVSVTCLHTILCCDWFDNKVKIRIFIRELLRLTYHLYWCEYTSFFCNKKKIEGEKNKSEN